MENGLTDIGELQLFHDEGNIALQHQLVLFLALEDPSIFHLGNRRKKEKKLERLINKAYNEYPMRNQKMTVWKGN